MTLYRAICFLGIFYLFILSSSQRIVLTPPTKRKCIIMQKYTLKTKTDKKNIGNEIK